MRTVAFFDLDNTRVRGSSLFHFGRFIVSRGFIPRRELVRFAYDLRLVPRQIAALLKGATFVAMKTAD